MSSPPGPSADSRFRARLARAGRLGRRTGYDGRRPGGPCARRPGPCAAPARLWPAARGRADHIGTWRGSVAGVRSLRRRVDRAVGEAAADAEVMSRFASVANQVLDASEMARAWLHTRRRGGRRGATDRSRKALLHPSPASLEHSRARWPPGGVGTTGVPRAAACAAPRALDARPQPVRVPGTRLAMAAATQGGQTAALEVEAQAGRMDSLRAEIAELVPRVEAGGRKARDALVRLIHDAPEPDAKELMKTMGIQAVASRLMKSPASSTELQRLAGSVLTLLTGMPVSSEISDDGSGSSGQINIVIPRASRMYRPDRAMAAMRAGARPSEAVRSP